ncbi:MAG: LysM peptidoglycan-binding domain-containing protein [Streptococcaceae bacterium]|nr:LysM peptidoglycan-binding domain-containing protein [Streptococcaceae bacterium]
MKTFNTPQRPYSATLSKKTFAFFTALLFAGGLFATHASADEVTYVVQAGDSLSQISDKFFGDQDHIQSIADANKIENIRLIHVGQELKFNTETQTHTPTKTESKKTTPAPAVTAPRTASIATRNGFTASSAKEAIAMTESGGSYTAQNGQYYGRYQLTLSYLGGDLSAENQERVADNYVAQRYGSWEAAWQFHLVNGWY